MKEQQKRELTKRERQVYETRAAVLKAMAHPVRLAILDALRERELAVGDLCCITGSEQSNTSRHLGVMREAGLLKADKRGLEVYYSLRVPCILNFFGCIESVLEARQRELSEVCGR